MSSVRLTTHLAQRLVLTPQLRQRIEMLQMTSVELSDLIQQQMLENPVLEEVASQEETRELAEAILDHQASGGNIDGNFDVQPAAPEVNDLNGAAGAEDFTSNSSSAENTFEVQSEDVPAYAEAQTDGEDGGEPARDAFEEIDFGREFQDYLDPGYKTQEYEYKEDAPTFEQFLTHPPSLSEHLMWQLHMDEADEEMLKAAECVVGNLDASGRLHATNEEIARLSDCSEEMVERARQIVMRLDPVGCSARDVTECLLVQLEATGQSDCLAAQILREHTLAELQPHKLPALSKQLGVPVETLGQQLEIVRQLEPHPGRRFSFDDTIHITPEIYIEKLDDDYVIYFADDGSPRLRISHSYRQMLERGDASKETRDFIKDKMRSAVDLLRNIEHRRQTIYRVVECIVHRQREFLDSGVQFIKPMMLKDVAEETGMHLSTVSRVVNRKYAHTPQGVIELRRFFTEGMTNEDGEEISTRIIKLKIKKIIEEEDSHNPVTDDQIVKVLMKEGIKLSRRTVAKYRDQMQIPGSRERRNVV
ncbi:MAG: RNA polymerase factor sigma-54 [Pyrinomonadaceae bacterium]|nr:RNA polymerase factor sigma-54 [Pyrinomonadaceae bacterium]